MKSPPSATVKPLTKDDTSATSAAHLMSDNRLKLGSSGSSPLGNLPPLSSGPKRSLAPLKKIPSSSPPTAQTSPLGQSGKVNSQAILIQAFQYYFILSAFNKPKETTTPPKEEANKRKEDVKDKSEDPGDEDEISEDLDEFLNSSAGASTSEDFTKDETASDRSTLKADFSEKV